MKGPRIKFHQPNGKQTCLVHSFASALFYIGLSQLASEIADSKQKVIDQIQTYQLFTDFFENKSQYLRHVEINVKEFDIFQSNDQDLLVVSLKGSDRKEDNCITIYGKWVFDSNFEYAMPLTKETLDLCCSSDEQPDTFVDIVATQQY